MVQKRPPATPKFKKGDRVTEHHHAGRLFISLNAQKKVKTSKDRGVGTVKSITVKKNKVGAGHFFYDVLWDGTGCSGLISQMRLMLADDESE